MTRTQTPSVRSTLNGIWSHWRRLVGRGDRPTGMSAATRARAIDLIEGDLECLIEDVSEKPIVEQSARELLLNRDLLVWLRGGPIPGQGAAELLEENLAVFYRPPPESDQANEKALRAALDELVRAQGSAARAGDDVSGERAAEAAGLTERDRCRFGLRLDELRRARNLTIGDLAARAGIDVVSIVAFIYGSEEAGAVEMMKLAAALGVVPRELFPDCLEGSEVEEGGDL